MVLRILPTSSSPLLLAFAIAFAAPAAHAQFTHKGPAAAIALAPTLPPYDVVSIKLHNSANEPMDQISASMSIHDDVFTATNIPLKNILEFAYDVKEDLIFGLSGPVDSARFDIEAKVLANDAGTYPKLTDTQLEAMIIPLLADRFHLKAHLQPKTQPIYELVVLHGEPKFKLAQTDEHNSSVNMSASNNDNVLTAKGASMADLAAALSDEAHRLVVDKTGLTGTADLTLKWTSDEAADQGGTVVSIFTAVEEQLGLKLQPAKGPVDTLVVDHAEMPSAN
ncbi:MAG: TIGR03435 family protein [Acidobacteriaceae bacterium]|jgi:uncharacterized protein (TIGR03435 family)